MFDIEARYLRHAYSRVRQGSLPWLLKTAMKRVTVPLGVSVDKALTGPIIGGLLLNYRCNLSCVYCSYWKVKTDEGELTTEQAFDLVDQFKEIGTSGLGLMGGEPLLRKDVFDIAKRVVRSGMTCAITTNGYPVNEKNADRLLDTGVNFVSVSLDSHDPEVNDYQRGEAGAHKKAISAMRLLIEERERRKLDTVIMMSTVVTPNNCDQIDKVVALAKDIGVDQIYLIGVDTAPAHKDTEKLQVTNLPADAYAKAMNLLLKEKSDTGFINTSAKQIKVMRDFQYGGKEFPYKCLAGYTSLYVDTYGRVFPCNAYLERKMHVDTVGNGRRLSDVWNSDEYQALRKSLLSCKSCYWPCQHEINHIF